MATSRRSALMPRRCIEAVDAILERQPRCFKKDILRGEATADDARAEGDGKLGTMLKQLLGETIARDRRSAYCVARLR